MNKSFEKTFISSSEILPEIEEFINDKISGLDLEEDTINNIEMAVAEAAANSILHGNKNDPNKSVIIKVNITNELLVLTFCDEGKGFNPDQVPDPTIPENILKGSGRGIHIMKSLVDELKYNFSDAGTELQISFFLN